MYKHRLYVSGIRILYQEITNEENVLFFVSHMNHVWLCLYKYEYVPNSKCGDTIMTTYLQKFYTSSEDVRRGLLRRGYARSTSVAASSREQLRRSTVAGLRRILFP